MDPASGNANKPSNAAQATPGTVPYTKPVYPYAEFTYKEISSGKVEFKDASIGYPSKYHWEFGDGSTSTVPSPTHKYQIPGSYEVYLSVTTEKGTNTKGATVTVAGTVSPSIAFTAHKAGLTVTFADASTGVPSGAGLQWDFGDGTTGSGLNPVHEYQEAGAYTVTLDAGAYGTSSQALNVVDQQFTDDLLFSFDNADGVSAATYTPDSGDPAYVVQGAGTTNPALVYISGGKITLSGVYVGLQWYPDISALPSTRNSNPSDWRQLKVKVALTGDGYLGAWMYDLGFDIDGGFITEIYCGSVYLAGSSGIAAGSGQTVVLAANDILKKYYLFVDDVLELEGSYTGTFDPYQRPHIAVSTDAAGGTITLYEFSASSEEYVEVLNESRIPAAAFAISPKTGDAPLTVQFDNNSLRADSYVWEFGDGSTSTAENPSHVYANGGIYAARLTATNTESGLTSTYIMSITVESVALELAFYTPVAKFTPSLYVAEQGQVVSFINTTTGAFTSAWDFGDGGTSTVKSPSHVFQSPGNYNVALTVTDSVTGLSTSFRIPIMIVAVGASTSHSDAAPIVEAIADTRSILKGGVVEFSASATNPVDSYAWDFGDGYAASGAAASHSYQTAGTYTVTLTTTNSKGTSIQTFSVEVADVKFAGTGLALYYLIDKVNHRVHIFDSAGKLTGSFGGLGSGDGEFINPTAVLPIVAKT
jgi:PKD repeat protein